MNYFYFSDGGTEVGLFLCQLSELRSRGSAGTGDSLSGKALGGLCQTRWLSCLD